MVRLFRSAALGAAALAFSFPAHAACDRILPSAGEAAAPVRGIAAADLIELRDIGSPESWIYSGVSPLALSPDGKSIAFVINRADIAMNSYCRALVVIPAGGGTPRVVDRGGEYSGCLQRVDSRQSALRSNNGRSMTKGAVPKAAVHSGSRNVR